LQIHPRAAIDSWYAIEERLIPADAAEDGMCLQGPQNIKSILNISSEKGGLQNVFYAELGANVAWGFTLLKEDFHINVS
jgi:hypothetical protein